MRASGAGRKLSPLPYLFLSRRDAPALCAGMYLSTTRKAPIRVPFLAVGRGNCRNAGSAVVTRASVAKLCRGFPFTGYGRSRQGERSLFRRSAPYARALRRCYYAPRCLPTRNATLCREGFQAAPAHSNQNRKNIAQNKKVPDRISAETS